MRSLIGKGGIAALVFVSLVLLPSSAEALSPRAKVGSIAPLPLFAQRVGPLAATAKLHLAIALQPRNPAALQAFATGVSTAGTAKFGHTLTVRQFARRFGAQPAAVAAVRAVLRRDGLAVGEASANELMFDATGSAGTVEHALHIQVDRVRLASGRIAYVNTNVPTLPRTVAPYVQGVIGLDTVAEPLPQELSRIRRPQRLAMVHPHAISSGPSPCSSATAINQNQQGYTADEIASMYGISSYYPGDEGAGQTVALVEEQPFQTSDIATYQACYGTNATINTINVDGGPGTFTLNDPNLGDDGESALDIEQVIGLAPKVTVDVYQAPDADRNPASPSDIVNAIVSQDQAKVISSSYGVCEALTPQSVIGAENTLLQEAATQGQSFFISSGDSGSNMCLQATIDESSPDLDLSVIDPGGQPFATGVGGTALLSTADGGSLPDNGDYPGEYVWNDGFSSRASGTGGGVSGQWPMPAYQAGAASSLDVIQSSSSRACSGQFCREVPDVSADADPNTGYVTYSTSYSGGTSSTAWGSTGGTSAAAPLWAAFTALANASSTCRGFTLGFVNPDLYSIAGSSYLSNFHDISQASPFTGQGNNDALYNYSLTENPNDLYPVLTGYDMATGLGTPIANTLGNSLCSMRAPVYSVSVASPGTQTSPTGKAVSLQVAGTDAGSGTTLTYSATGLPAGLAISTTGAITGTPTTPGTSTVTVSASDQFTNAGSVQFSWTVVKPGLPAALGSLRGFKKGKVTLGLKLAAGSYAPALASVKVTLPKGMTFAKKSKSLKKGITVKAGSTKVAFKTSGGGGSLTLRLATPEPALTITIAKPAIVESSKLEHKIDKRKTKQLGLVVIVTDAGGTATRITGTFKV